MQADGVVGALILEVRPSAAFEQLHRTGSVNIPFEELRQRSHELPPRYAGLTVFDTDEARARQAACWLRDRGRSVAAVFHGQAWLSGGATASGPSGERLWRPHGLLVEAVGTARTIWGELRGRRVLDVACGSGRDAVFLAMAGFDVEAWDILPDALDRCRDLAARNQVAISLECRDLKADRPVETNHYDLICCFYFLYRPAVDWLSAAVRPGGLVVFETFVEPQQRLFGRPRREACILRRGELAGWFRGWDVLLTREGLAEPDRCSASLIARKPMP